MFELVFLVACARMHVRMLAFKLSMIAFKLSSRKLRVSSA